MAPARSVALLALLNLLRRAAPSTTATVSASDPRVTWVGRTQATSGGSVHFDYEGVYATVTVASPFSLLTAAISDHCVGTGVGGGSRWAVTMTTADTRAAAPQHRVSTFFSDASVYSYVLFSSPGARCDPNCDLNGNITFRLQRLTESRLSGCSTTANLSVVSFSTDGTFVAPPAPLSRRLEFVGDSITAGDLNDGDGQAVCGNSVFNDDITFSSGGQLCLPQAMGGFGADCMYTAWGGIQLGATGWGMRSLYLYTFSAGGADAYEPWDFARFQADAVIVNLGTNDNPVAPALAWQAAYVAFVTDVAARYSSSPSAPAFFLAYGPMTAHYEPFVLNITATLKSAGLNATALDLTLPHGMTGCYGHPSRADNVEIAAKAKPQIAAVLGWGG